ncbi:MAG: pilus assembly protein [Actinobacteria bacterium]|nr:MAG: pilus assembly protein [Actinomycetota bacterium]
MGIGSEDGATAIEFALLLPLLVMVLVGTFQFGLAYNNYLAITHAAREGARMAAVGAYDEAAVRSSAYPVNPTSVSLSYPRGSEHGDPAEVTVRADFDLSIPFFSQMRIPLRSTASMRIER